MAANMGKT